MSSTRSPAGESTSIDERLDAVTGSQIRQKVWHQGAILGAALAGEVATTTGRVLATGSHLVVVSQDCDVVSPNLVAEPVVELLIARVVGKKDGNLTRGKNPRVIHFPASIDDEEVILEANASERFFADRRFLGLETPFAGLGGPEKRQVRRWLARRYDRAAFPDEFNDRVRPAASSIKKLISKSGKQLSAIFLFVADEELPSGRDYRIDVIAALDVDRYADQQIRQSCERLLAKVVGALNQCDGIQVVEDELRSEAEISLDDLTLLKRWDWEYLSLKSEPPDPTAPHP